MDINKRVNASIAIGWNNSTIDLSLESVRVITILLKRLPQQHNYLQLPSTVHQKQLNKLRSLLSTCTKCSEVMARTHEYIKNHNSLGKEWPSGLHVHVDDLFQPTLDLISCAGVTGSEGTVGHAHATQSYDLPQVYVSKNLIQRHPQVYSHTCMSHKSHL